MDDKKPNIVGIRVIVEYEGGKSLEFHTDPKNNHVFSTKPKGMKEFLFKDGDFHYLIANVCRTTYSIACVPTWMKLNYDHNKPYDKETTASLLRGSQRATLECIDYILNMHKELVLNMIEKAKEKKPETKGTGG